VLDCFGGGLTTGRTALRWGRKFIGFELNKNAHDAFVPTLNAVEELPDPIPVSPDAIELAKREKMREGWRKDRAKKKLLVPNGISKTIQMGNPDLIDFG
jgi:hypothetical protein